MSISSRISFFLICGLILLASCSGGRSGVRKDSSTENTAPRGEDGSPPSVSLSTEDLTSTSLTKLSIVIEFSEPVTGFDLSDITYSGGVLSDLQGSGASYTAQLRFLTSGVHTLSIPAEAAQDSAGNKSLVSNTLSISYTPGDEVAQVLTPPASSSNSTDLNIDVSGADLASYHYKIGLKDSIDCSDPTGYNGPIDAGTNITNDISGLGDGEIVVCMVGTDSQGRQQDYSNATEYVVNIDTQAPSVTGLSDDATWVNSKTWNWSCSEECSYDFVIDSSAGTDPSGSYLESTFATHSSGEGQVYIHVQARDAAGNESVVVQALANIDAVAPATPGSMDDSSFINSLTASPTASWAASTDNGSGLSHYELAIGTSAGGADVQSWADVGTSVSHIASGLTLSEGTTYYTSVRAVDNVGNYSTPAQGDGWSTDLSGPSAVTDLSDSAGDGSLTSTPTISWTAATDSGSGVSYYELALGTSAGGTDILDWKNIGGNTSHKETGLSLTDGLTYYASIRAVDNLGNRGVVASSAGWVASAAADPCSGTTIGQACSGTLALYAGEFNGAKYMITPANCTDSATPTCDGSSDIWSTNFKTWRGTNGSDVNIAGVEDIASAATPSTVLGDVNTAAIVAHASVDSDSAAHYCHNMTYGGYDDWYLPSKSELAHLYCYVDNGNDHPSVHPQENPDCASKGGKQYLIGGFNREGGIYLSSTEANSENPWSISIGWGNLVAIQKKNEQLYVRCIRRY